MQIARMGFWLGTTVFGGVNVAYPIIRERAQELGNITPEDVDGFYALAVFLPGPSFLNLWGGVTIRAAGVAGALVGNLALMLPAFLLVLLLPLSTRIAYVGAHGSGALNGAVWATAGLLIATGVDSYRKLQTGFHRLLVPVLLAGLLLGLHPVFLLVATIGAGALSGYVMRKKETA